MEITPIGIQVNIVQNKHYTTFSSDNYSSPSLFNFDKTPSLLLYPGSNEYDDANSLKEKEHLNIYI